MAKTHTLSSMSRLSALLLTLSLSSARRDHTACGSLISRLLLVQSRLVPASSLQRHPSTLKALTHKILVP